MIFTGKIGLRIASTFYYFCGIEPRNRVVDGEVETIKMPPDFIGIGRK